MACSFIFLVSAKTGSVISRCRKSSNTEDAGKKLDRFVPFLRRAGSDGLRLPRSSFPGARWLLVSSFLFGISLRAARSRRALLAEQFRARVLPFFRLKI